MAAMNEWMRGKCWDMAVALHEKTSLPLYGLFDQHGGCHHAFVLDAELNMGLDARGTMPVDRLKRGCAGQEVRPLAREAIEQAGGYLGRPLDKQELQAAWRYAKRIQVVESWESKRASLIRAAAPASGLAL